VKNEKIPPKENWKGQRLTVHCWLSTANCQRSTVNRGYSTLCL
jgi:hypothetical protein